MHTAARAGEIVPQAVCSRYGVKIGSALAPLVRLLMWLCAPITWPMAKLLDWILGHEDVVMQRRQLKAMVQLHAEEAGEHGRGRGARGARGMRAASSLRTLQTQHPRRTRATVPCPPSFRPRPLGAAAGAGLGGKLTEQEVAVIHGAMDLRYKTALTAMTPLNKVPRAHARAGASGGPRADSPNAVATRRRRSGAQHKAGWRAPACTLRLVPTSACFTGRHAQRQRAAGRADCAGPAAKRAQPRARISRRQQARWRAGAGAACNACACEGLQLDGTAARLTPRPPCARAAAAVAVPASVTSHVLACAHTAPGVTWLASSW